MQNENNLNIEFFKEEFPAPIAVWNPEKTELKVTTTNKTRITWIKEKGVMIMVISL